MMALLYPGFIAMPAVMAQSAPSTPSDYLERFDLDGDGRIALSEYRDYMSRGFRDMDVDGDGLLQGNELPVPGARPVRLTDHLDALAQSFHRQDRNADGYLDAAELASPPR